MTSEWHVRLHRALENLRRKRSASEIADRYLSLWGGVADGLPLLATDPALCEVDGGYGLRNLVPHLLEAGRDEDVHRLLACERPSGTGRPGVVNVWFDARHRVGDVDGYLQDLDAARLRAREATDADVAAGRPPASLGLEMRYALMEHSAKSAGERVHDELAVMLTETGHWDVTRALSNARRHETGEDRCRALLALLPHVPERQKPEVAREAMINAMLKAGNSARGGANEPLVDEVATTLSPDDWSPILSLVEEDVRDDYLSPTGGALTALLPHLPAELLDRALAIAATLPPNVHRAIALEKLAPRLPAATAVDALPAAREITEPEYRADVLIALLPRLPEDVAAPVRAEARAAVGSIDPPTRYDDPVRRRSWARLIPLLPHEERRAAIAEALEGEHDAEGHAHLLADVATELPAAERGPFLDEATSVARGIPDPFERARTLLVIADLLPRATQATTLAAARISARDISEPFDRAQILISLAERVTATDRHLVLDEALADARRIADDDDRAYLLIEIAARLPRDRQGPPLAEAVRAARAIKDDDRRFHLLLDAARLLTGAPRHAALAEALDIKLAAIGFENYFNGPVLDDLAPVLPEDLMIEVLEAVRDTGRPGYLARVLHRRAGHLSGAALEAGLAMARTVTGRGRAHQRAAVLTALADQLPAEQRLDVLEEALAAAREARHDLTAIARRLPEERRAALMTEQLTFHRRYRINDTPEKRPAAKAVPAVFEAVRVPAGWGRDSGARAALVRAQRAHRRGADPTTVIGLIREALHRYRGGDPPAGSPALAAAARDLGGPAAMEDYVKAARDVHRWWP
ncbi:hypothetical protein [Amycolatopsis granulosa]|uniref:hypothetical protein n=1 Tax=Amycolatopsis granulosa TaxID=185684 RepID=UPI00141F102B|nr:hypothetical protein [Amycolatopsis granulosa]NIH87692.1 hypothetical protein [Amycolatopsis granulosa]